MKSRLQIPLLFMGDVIHGYRTTFPINIATASSWDTTLIRKMDSIAAFEATADGMNWSFAPMVDVSQDARWGRVMESAGEDPFLGSQIAAGEIRGLQGDDLSNPRTMAATAKHFAGYGGVEAGRDYNTVDMSWRKFHEIHLPPFQAAIQIGVASIMPGFISLNGIPASGNKYLLKTILRENNLFDGLLVSDYDAVPEMMEHRVVASIIDAVEKGINAGIEMDLHSQTYLAELPKLVTQGRISEDQVDVAVKHVLKLKYKLGLFDHPFAYGNKDEAYQETLLERHRPIARDLGRKSIVLLKNKSLRKQDRKILPLAKNIGTLAVIGPLAKNKPAMLGAVHAKGKSEEVITPWQGIKEAVSSDTELLYAKGTDVRGESTEGFDNAVSKAERADAVVLTVGRMRR